MSNCNMRNKSKGGSSWKSSFSWDGGENQLILASSSACQAAASGFMRRLHTSALLSSAGDHQSPIVDELWRRRRNDVTTMAADAADTTATATTTTAPKNASASSASAAGVGVGDGERNLVERSWSDSHTRIVYNFSENEEMMDRYSNPWGGLRTGRLLEDLDALAGTVAHKHCLAPLDPHTNAPSSPLQNLVTAAVDRIRVRPQVAEGQGQQGGGNMPKPSDGDIEISGEVAWVGRTSLVIAITASTCAQPNVPFLESTFTFVARDATTGKASPVNPLLLCVPTVIDEKAHAAAYAHGERLAQAKKARRALIRNSLVGEALDERGRRAAVDLLAEGRALCGMPTLARLGDILVSDTALSNTMITQPQHRNTAGRIFGGFLMRRAYELAFSTAYLFAGERPVFAELDDVAFLQPVVIGDLLRLDSRVLFTSEAIDPEGRPTVHIEVAATVVRPEERTRVPSNTFNFTFRLYNDLALRLGDGQEGEEECIEEGEGEGEGLAQEEREDEENNNKIRNGSTGGKRQRLRRVLPSTLEEALTIVQRHEADVSQCANDS